MNIMNYTRKEESWLACLPSDSRDDALNVMLEKLFSGNFYSVNPEHLERVKRCIAERSDADKIVVEVLPLSNYVKSDDEHQDRLTLHPNDYCHIPKAILHKYKK